MPRRRVAEARRILPRWRRPCTSVHRDATATGLGTVVDRDRSLNISGDLKRVLIARTPTLLSMAMTRRDSFATPVGPTELEHGNV